MISPIENRNKLITQTTTSKKTNNQLEEIKPLKLIPPPEYIKEKIKKQEDTVNEKQNEKDMEQKRQPLVLKQKTKSFIVEKEHDENDEIEFSDRLLPHLTFAIADIRRKLVKFSRTPESKLPKNSPEYWRKLTECLRNEN